MNLKHEGGVSTHDYVDYFKNENNFMGTFFEKLGSMSQFFTKEIKPEFKIEIGNIHSKEIQKLQAKVLKPANKIKISNIEIEIGNMHSKEIKNLKPKR